MKQFDLSNFSFIRQYYKVNMLTVIVDHSDLYNVSKWILKL